MSYNKDDITPDVNVDDELVQSTVANATRKVFPRSIMSDVYQVKQGSLIMENGKSASGSQFNEEFFRRFPDTSANFTKDNKNGPFSLEGGPHGAPINNPKMIKMAFSCLGQPIMNHGSNIVLGQDDGHVQQFFRKYQYFKEDDSIIMFNKEHISSKNDHNSYMFHRLNAHMYNTFINKMMQSHFNCVVCVCMFSEIRNFMKFTVKDGYEYSSGKPRAWFAPRTHDYNPSTLPMFLMDEVFNFSNFYQIDTPEYDKFCVKFKENMKFDFNKNWITYKDFIIMDYVTGNGTHTSLSNAFFNKYIINMDVKQVPRTENEPPFGYMPFLSVFRSFFLTGKNNKQLNENDLITFDDMPFVFLENLFQIADFGPLPGSIPLFMSVCSSNAEHLFKDEKTSDPIALKDRLPIAISFYRNLLDLSYVSRIMKKIFPMSKQEFEMFKTTECAQFMDLMEKGKSKMYIEDKVYVPNDPAQAAPVKSYKDIAGSSNGPAPVEEECVHHLPSGVITSPSSPDKRSMNIEAPPFDGPNLQTPPHMPSGYAYGVYAPPGNPIMPYMPPSPHMHPLQSPPGSELHQAKYMDLTVKVDTRTLANWVAMFHSRDVAIASIVPSE